MTLELDGRFSTSFEESNSGSPRGGEEGKSIVARMGSLAPAFAFVNKKTGTEKLVTDYLEERGP